MKAIIVALISILESLADILAAILYFAIAVLIFCGTIALMIKVVVEIYNLL